MDPRYPIGRFVWDKTSLTSGEREALVAQIAAAHHLLARYAWHGRHHVAYITSLRDRMGWDA